MLALALATPVLLCALVSDVALRLIAGGPGAARPWIVAARPWLCTALALLALTASWDAYPEAWATAAGFPP